MKKTVLIWVDCVRKIRNGPIAIIAELSAAKVEALLLRCLEVLQGQEGPQGQQSGAR